MIRGHAALCAGFFRDGLPDFPPTFGTWQDESPEAIGGRMRALRGAIWKNTA